MRIRRAVHRVSALLGATVVGLVLVAGAAAGAGAEWPGYEQNAQHSSATATDPTITAGNAPTLIPRWRFTPPGPTRAGQPVHTFRASPTVSGGKVYIGSNTGVLYALDATTGAVVWQRLLDYGTGVHCGAAGIGSTASVAPDPVTKVPTVYAAGAHYLYALDAATGAVVWKVAVGGSADLSYNYASPAVAGGRIFMGVNAACTNYEHIRGAAQSFDQHTGTLLHTYYVMPAGSLGGSIWSSPATDGTSVWVSTGDPVVTSPQVGDSYSIVRLDAATLAKTDRWRTSDAPSADYDFGSSPTLWTSSIGGTDVPLVGACNKNGNFYALRSGDLAAGPVWQRQVGQPASNPFSFCITSGAYDASRQRLFIASNTTEVNGRTVPGAIRAVDPATGAYLWEQPLDCGPLGSPTLNTASGIVAVPTYICATGQTPSVRLYDEATGRLITTITSAGPVFAQPVFAAGELLIAGGGSAATGGASLTAYVPKSDPVTRPPSQPTAVKAVSTTPTTATLTWTKPAGAGTGPITGYTVGRDGTDSHGGGAWTGKTSATTLSQTFTQLVAGRTYHLSVAATSAAGPGPAVTVAVTIGVATAPRTFVITKKVTARTATISWTPPANTQGSVITGYRVGRNGTDSGGGGPYAATIAPASRSFTFKYLVPGRTYTLTVQAVTARGPGAAASGTARL